MYKDDLLGPVWGPLSFLPTAIWPTTIVLHIFWLSFWTISMISVDMLDLIVLRLGSTVELRPTAIALKLR